MPALENDDLEVRFQLDKRELSRHILFTLRRELRWPALLIAALFTLAVVLVLILEWLGSPSAAWASVWLLGVALLIVLAWALTFVVARMQARRLLTTSRELAGELVYRIHSWGLEYESEVSSGRMDWSALHSAVEREDAFILFPSAGQFVLLPKRAFRNSAAQEEFRDLAREAIGPKADFQPSE